MKNNLNLSLSLGLIISTIILTPPLVLAQQPLMIAQEKNIIYVNPQTGNDQKGNGTEHSPFQTITQALMLAKNGSTIKLAAGNYTQETGENFPLIIKSNITIEGDINNKGKDIIIKGNGPYISPTSAGQHVTIVTTEKKPIIRGITVINPHNQGYPMWIESSDSNINNNSFLNSGNGGVSINGESRALISNNYFYNIQGNGIVIYGKSQPEIKNNEIRNTGYGVSILQNSAPILTDNLISNTRIGVILENNSQAKLRGNTIEYSEDNGLVTLKNSWVDLGTQNDAGNNIFAQNQKGDIHNISEGQIIPAFGNQISSNTRGPIDFIGISKRKEVVDNINNKPILLVNNDTNNNSNISININNKPIPQLQSITLPPEEVVINPPVETKKVTPPPVITRNSGTLPPPPTINNSTPNNTITNNNTTSIPITIINPPSSNNTLTQPPNPVTNIKPNRKELEELITVRPNFNNNNNGQLTFKNDRIPINNNQENSAEKPPEIIVYRVMVEPLNDTQKKEIKQRYPQAFTTTYNGQSMWQISSFQDQFNAQKLLETLNQMGITGIIVR